MRSFGLAALTFLTLGIFSFAAPTPVPNGGLVNADVKADVEVNVKRGDHESHGDHDLSLVDILDEVVESVEVIIDKILDIEGEATTEILSPLLHEVEEILEVAIKAVKALVSLDGNSILKTVTGLLDLDGLAKLLCEVLTVVLKLVQLILKIVTAVVKLDILPLLCKILDLVAELITCILGLSIVGKLVGLILAVVALVDKILLDIICDLNVTSLIKVLGL